MEFEVIRKSHKKEIIIGVSLFVIIAIVLVVRLTFAKYSLVKSIKIAEGTINYKVPDFKIMAMYKNDGNGDIAIDTMPDKGYTINETKSYCTLDNKNKDTNAKLYTNSNGEHIFKNLAKNSKCYVYFDKYILSSRNIILSNVKINSGTPDFSKISIINEGVYIAKDNDGDSYYFRGATTDNYVKFGGFYWRIVRINGDGTIRLIYDGTEAHDNGVTTADSIAIANQAFNTTYNNNAYVGFKYTVGQLRGLGTKSNILTQLETWYKNNLSSYVSKIDTNAGFCGDRTPSTSANSINNSGGTGTTATYYASYIRLVYVAKTPVLTCSNAGDLYTVTSSNKGSKSLTYPIGLISADEVIMAGGAYNSANTNFYLNNGQSYWTMTPHNFSSQSITFAMRDNSYLYALNVNTVAGIRPVINLRADVTLTGAGTMHNPYVVQ